VSNHVWYRRPGSCYCHLQICWCGAPSLTREQVCSLQLLLAFASTVVLGCSWPYFTISDSRLTVTWKAMFPFFISPRHWVSFSLSPVTYRTTVEVLTHWLTCPVGPCYIALEQNAQKTPFLAAAVADYTENTTFSCSSFVAWHRCCHRDIFIVSLSRSAFQLSACMSQYTFTKQTWLGSSFFSHTASFELSLLHFLVVYKSDMIIMKWMFYFSGWKTACTRHTSSPRTERSLWWN
jgi:hypothetical protein